MEQVSMYAKKAVVFNVAKDKSSFYLNLSPSWSQKQLLLLLLRIDDPDDPARVAEVDGSPRARVITRMDDDRRVFLGPGDDPC